MTTKKEIIVKRFLKYEHEIKQLIDASILPSLEDIDVCDLLIFINIYFNNDNDKETIIYSSYLDTKTNQILNIKDSELIDKIILKFIQKL